MAILQQAKHTIGIALEGVPNYVLFLTALVLVASCSAPRFLAMLGVSSAIAGN